MPARISPRQRSLIVDKDGHYLDINDDGSLNVSSIIVDGDGDELDINPDGSLNTESKIVDSDGDELDVNVDGSINVVSNNKDWFQKVGEGEIPGYSIVEKFGENILVTTSSDPEDVWDFGGIYTFSTTDDIDRLSSSDNTDTQDIIIYGLNSDWEEVVQTVTLTGQTPVALDTDLIRVYRMINLGTTDIAGNVYCFVNGSVTGGVPDTDADIRAMIRNDNNQTLMCIYTVPAGKTGYFWAGYVSISRGTSSTAYADFTWRARVLGGVFSVKSRISVVSAGQSSWDYTYKIPLALPEKTDVLIRCDEVSGTMGLSGGFTVLLKDN